MIWKKQKAAAIKSQRNQDQRNRELKRLILKYKWVHFWGVPLVFFLSYSTFFVAHMDFYHVIYPYISELYGYSLYVCGVLLAVSVLYEGCLWHYASIFGMITNNIMISIFASDPYEVANHWNFVSMTVWIVIIFAFIIKEEILDK